MSQARTRLVAATERLVAERGIEVPLRDIAAAAGQRNHSAVQYHFGTREGLLEAVLRERMVPLGARMLERLADLEAVGAEPDLADLLAVIVEPLATVPYELGSTHYARFLEQVRTHPVLAQTSLLELENWAAVRLVLSRLGRRLELPVDVRRRRLRSMATVMFALLADRERDPGQAATVAEVVDLLVAHLSAPALREPASRE